MSVQEFYERINGDYKSIAALFKTDERIITLLKMIFEDENFDLLRKSMASQDYETAFRAAHTMKGFCLNLCLTQLQKSVSDLTEALRGTVKPNAAELYRIVEDDYANLLKNLNELVHE